MKVRKRNRRFFDGPMDWEELEVTIGVDDYRSSSITPERRLITKMLERAILDLKAHKRAWRESSIEWIFGESDPVIPFSFAWVCEYLRLSPNKIRSQCEGYMAQCSRAQLDTFH